MFHNKRKYQKKYQLQKGMKMINALVFIISIITCGILLRIFGYSQKNLIQIIINAVIGIIALYVTKYVGIPITINWISIMIVSFLGLPGVIIILIFSN